MNGDHRWPFLGESQVKRSKPDDTEPYINKFIVMATAPQCWWKPSSVQFSWVQISFMIRLGSACWSLPFLTLHWFLVRWFNKIQKSQCVSKQHGSYSCYYAPSILSGASPFLCCISPGELKHAFCSTSLQSHTKVYYLAIVQVCVHTNIRSTHIILETIYAIQD